MRAIVDVVDSEHGNARAWKLHWDRQLLKVLGVAYRYNFVKKIQKRSKKSETFDHNKVLCIYK